MKKLRPDQIRRAQRRGDFVHLRPVTEEDLPFLYYIATVDENLVRWRLRGTPIDSGSFQQFLWGNSASQFIICANDSGQPVGHVCTYQANEWSGTAYFAAVLSPDVRKLGWALEGVALAFSYFFDTFRIRKLYFEVPDYNRADFESIVGSLLVEEGRLEDSVFAFGEYWTVSILTLTSEAWSSARAESPSGLGTSGLVKQPESGGRTGDIEGQ